MRKQSRAYFNEIEPYAAEWLRGLIACDLIAPGDVDTRSIEDVTPEDLRGYTQCHFFAGIGGWSLALRLAGWPDDRPVWTGSCPCQPFSAAGKGAGFSDERHLWPAWYWLIQQCRPGIVFGEQVEAAIKHGWLDLVQADLEGIGYSVGAVGIPAAGVGAPHGRARLWFVADAADGGGWGGISGAQAGVGPDGERRRRFAGSSLDGSVADDDEAGRRVERSAQLLDGKRAAQRHDSDGCGEPVGLADPYGTRSPARLPEQAQRQVGVAGIVDYGGGEQPSPGQRPTPFWSNLLWLPCRDGKARPTQPGLFPLAHGVPARVGRLRAYGNAIVPQVAAEVIRAFMECRP